MIDYFPKLASEIDSAIRETAVDLFDAGAQFLQSLWRDEIEAQGDRVVGR